MASFTVSIEKTRAGNFQVRSRDENGRRTAHYCVDKNDHAVIDGRDYAGKSLAKKYRDLVLAKHRQGELGVWDLSEKCEELMELYLRSCEGNNYSSYTVQHKRNSLEPFFRDNKILCLSDLNRDMILGWRDVMFKAGFAVSTIRGRLADVRSFLNWLVENKKIKESPFGVKLMPKDKDPEPKFYTASEWAALDTVLARVSPGTRLLCNLAHGAGLRKAEALAVEWGDIAYGADGGAEIHVRKEVSKGKRRGRMVPLDPGLVALLKPTENKRIVPLTRYQVDHYFAIARRDAGIKADLDIHGLRHTFAKNYLQAGGDIRALMALMGHANIATTQIYTHLESAHYRKAIEQAYQRQIQAEQTLAVVI